MHASRNIHHWANITFLILGILLAGYLFFIAELDPDKPSVARTAGLAVLMATLWITEWIPLAATSLLPMFVLPFLGVQSGKEVAAAYFSDIIFLFIGGFLIALAMQRWDLHRRIALRVLMVFGTEPRMLLLGSMAVTAFLSMWISNTAATMMMVTVVSAVLLTIDKSILEKQNKNTITEDSKVIRAQEDFSVALLLGTAYGATIGGIATIVGTPPNMSFVTILERQFPGAPPISFANWMLFALPISLVLFVAAWVALICVYVRPKKITRISNDRLKQTYIELGKTSFAQWVVFGAFTTVVVLWISRADLVLGNRIIYGWERLLPEGSFVKDGSVAIGVALILFFIPSLKSGKKNESDPHVSRIMDWETAKKIPWNIILLFGGGFALAGAFRHSGLTSWLGEQMSGMDSFSPLLIIALACLAITFLTELTSNAATTEMMLPIMGSLAVAIGVHPLFLMVPVTLSCSCAFMMPVATPPNAIIFGTGRVGIQQMFRTGLILNFVGVVVVVMMTWWLAPLVFGFDISVLPDWAKP